MKYFTLLLALTGCSLETVPEHTPACPDVQCAWTSESTCPTDAAFSSESNKLTIDDGATACWVYNAVCIVTQAEPVRPECIPDACRQNRFTTCQPDGAARVGGS